MTTNDRVVLTIWYIIWPYTMDNIFWPYHMVHIWQSTLNAGPWLLNSRITLICNVWQTKDLKSRATGLVYELISSNEIILDYHKTTLLVKVWHFWQSRQFYYGDPNTIITLDFCRPLLTVRGPSWTTTVDGAGGQMGRIGEVRNVSIFALEYKDVVLSKKLNI